MNYMGLAVTLTLFLSVFVFFCFFSAFCLHLFEIFYVILQKEEKTDERLSVIGYREPVEETQTQRPTGYANAKS